MGNPMKHASDREAGTSTSSRPQHWYALHVKSRHEKKIALMLGRMGYEAYLPLRHTRSRRRDRKVMVDLPALSGYLFVRCEMTPAERAEIKRTSGVRLLETQGQPCVIPDIQIEWLQLALRLANDEVLAHVTFEKGDRVRVIHGPMEGMEGYLIRIDGKERLVIALQNMTSAISIEIDAADIEKINGWARHP